MEKGAGLASVGVANKSEQVTSLPAGSRILYLTMDGVLEPLGRSQIVEYLFGLAARGHRYTLVSLEKEWDLRDDVRVQAMRREFREAGIDWHYRPYRWGSGRSDVLDNCRDLYQLAWRELRRGDVSMLHARAHVPGLLARLLKLRTGKPYLFDMRSFWIDEKRVEGAWFTNSLLYRTAKMLEQWMVQGAAGIVTLTQLASDELRQSTLDGRALPMTVIPTCANFDELRGALDAKLHHTGPLTIGWVGSVNRSYCPAESLELVRRLLELRPDARFLAVTQQRDKVVAMISEAGVPSEKCEVVSCARQDLPTYLSRMDWGLLIMNTNFAKRASMPTKLAEFLAAGVRPIQYGGNPEISDLVRACGSGLVLRDLTGETLGRAASEIAAAPLAPEPLLEARRRAQAHFRVGSAIEKYHGILDSILSGAGAGRRERRARG